MTGHFGARFLLVSSQHADRAALRRTCDRRGTDRRCVPPDEWPRGRAVARRAGAPTGPPAGRVHSATPTVEPSCAIMRCRSSGDRLAKLPRCCTHRWRPRAASSSTAARRLRASPPLAGRAAACPPPARPVAAAACGPRRSRRCRRPRRAPRRLSAPGSAGTSAAPCTPAAAASRGGRGGVIPSAVYMSVVGRKRSAWFGIRMTLCAVATSMRTVRRHARAQTQVRIRHVDPDRVGDDVLRGRRHSGARSSTVPRNVCSGRHPP